MTQSQDLSRRQVAAGLAAAVLGLAAVPARAADWRFRAIDVDTRPLAALGLPNYAVRVRETALPIVRQTFADRMVPGDRNAPVLVIRFNQLMMTSYAGGRSGASPSGADGEEARDWVVGAGVVVGPGGQELAEIPITSSRAAADGGPWYLPDNGQRRLVVLCETLAYWVKRGL